MRVYVLGAGASHHAGYPLTAGLTRELVSWLTQNREKSSNFETSCQTLSTFRATMGTDDLEEILEAAKGSVKGLSIAMGDSIEGLFVDLRRKRPSTAYEAFAKIACRPGDTVVTFNYDDAVETALREANLWEVWDGYGFQIRDDVGTPTRIPVLKLHGSVNWWASLFGGTKGFSMFDSRHTLGLRPVVSDHHLQALGYTSQRDPACPLETAKLQVMIAPFRKKEFFFETSFGQEYGDFYDGLWEVASSALRRASEVFVLGYSLPASDVRARDLLFDSVPISVPLKILSGSRSPSLAEEFRTRGFRAVSYGETRFEALDWESHK